MFSVLLECSAGEKDGLIAELWERGCCGVVEDDQPGGICRLRAFFEARAELEALQPYGATWQEEDTTDWDRLWRSCWEPFPVGERFFLVPEWRDDRAPEGRIRLPIRPGGASGSGIHPPTQLCLEAMERLVRTGDRVLDVGTGSGILAAAAALLGAGQVVACDIDMEAAAAAASAFQDRHPGVGLFVGSARSMATGSMDLIVANLNAQTILVQAREMARVRRPGGRLILSGFPERNGSRVERALREAGVEIRERTTRDGWVCAVGD